MTYTRMGTEHTEDICRRLPQPRPSLSPSQFSKGAFEDFQDRNRAASSESSGNTGAAFYSEEDKLFNNLAKFAPGITDAKPDGYDGARLEEIDLAVRRDL
ncbi:hypothetical protein LTR91_025248 [Friedmanniomyces endolithicus]|uniref:Uncharacterized protein n=1 Tax=Friedmanniomyces endolithicus TaxID=329885 RepID=A0AAN6F8E6_9PEZI|nr:hypothetical protein LTR35_017953 [Friedmanniomyces endolithicus]KAK0267543.1 hypothetical protein LTS00_017779 [Friedmanniomyces endolithicus]KAK0301822.1 hypothetical protein LTR01_009137 [Friedmanniomyces endolithicus]KAK0304441.1 hypothetical protein LTR82_017190 [Friedmanniomyces endolithicus]KAK0822637.1 hypothetical protein LTR73_009163 [Friedmanniomyces endolithicus]